MQIFPSQQTITLKGEVGEHPIQIVAISSSSILVVFGDTIEIAINEKVMSLYFLMRQKKIPWVRELTPAYASLGIIYDLYFIKKNFNIEGLVFDWVKKQVTEFLKELTPIIKYEQEIIEIPVCFNSSLPNDLSLMSKTLDLSVHKIMDIFLSKTYHVFMLGFLPGFSYMGDVDDKIAISRKATPTQIKAGAVGIAGKQTGIYPLNSLGGWHIIGHTTLNIFDFKNNPPNFLNAGDKLKFLEVAHL